MKHRSKDSCAHSYAAFQTGYSDARFDGIDTSSELPCGCRACCAAYQHGWDEGIRKALEFKKKMIDPIGGKP